MMFRKSFSMLLLLLCAASLGCASANEFLFQTAAAKARLSEYEHSTACLKLAHVDSCNIGVQSIFETTMTCCTTDPREHEAFSPTVQLDSVGKCAWTYALSVPLAWIELLDGGGSLGQLPSTARFGTYTVQCELDKDAEKAGESLAPNMILESQGPLYAIFDAAIPSPTPSPSYSDALCRNLTFGNEFLGGLPGGGRVTSGGSQAALDPVREQLSAVLHEYASRRSHASSGAKLGRHLLNSQRTAAAAGTYAPGVAFVVAGPVHITSLDTDVKVEQGFLQAVVDVFAFPEASINPSEGTFVADNPFFVELKLRKAADSYARK